MESNTILFFQLARIQRIVTLMMKKYCHNAFVIFDSVELHFLRGMCEVALKDVEKSKEHELGIMSKADLTFVCNSVGLDILSVKTTERRIENVHPPCEIPGTTTNFENRKEIAFIGGYQHPPNMGAVKNFFKKYFL